MLLQKVCAGPKTKFNKQKSSFGIAQKVLIPQITILRRDTNISIPTSANKLFIGFGFTNLLLNIITYNCKYCLTKSYFTQLKDKIALKPKKVENSFKLKQADGKNYSRFKPLDQHCPHDRMTLVGICENLTKLTSYVVAQTFNSTRYGELVMIYILCLPEQVMIYINAYLKKVIQVLILT